MGEGAHIQARSMAPGNHEKKVTEGLVRVDSRTMLASDFTIPHAHWVADRPTLTAKVARNGRKDC
jgi:hypothetical protein